MLNWKKPQRVMSEQERRERYSSDCGVPGTFVPNMSDADRAAWKATLCRRTTSAPHVEIRKDSAVIVVSLGGGYKYQHYEPERTKGFNLHIACAGPLQLDLANWRALQSAVEEAFNKLAQTQAKPVPSFAAENPVLMWEKPQKVLSEERRRELFSSDSEVPGTYVPNMSDADRARWKAKLTQVRSGHPQVEIRKDSAVVIVSLEGGYKYKWYTSERTREFNLHIASAGPLQLSGREWANMKQAVKDALEKLAELKRPA